MSLTAASAIANTLSCDKERVANRRRYGVLVVQSAACRSILTWGQLRVERVRRVRSRMTSGVCFLAQLQESVAAASHHNAEVETIESRGVVAFACFVKLLGFFGTFYTK